MTPNHNRTPEAEGTYYRGIVPFKTAKVKLVPQKERPELKAVSPGMDMSNPATAAPTPVW